MLFIEATFSTETQWKMMNAPIIDDIIIIPVSEITNMLAEVKCNEKSYKLPPKPNQIILESLKQHKRSCTTSNNNQTCIKLETIPTNSSYVCAYENS